MSFSQVLHMGKEKKSDKGKSSGGHDILYTDIDRDKRGREKGAKNSEYRQIFVLKILVFQRQTFENSSQDH